MRDEDRMKTNENEAIGDFVSPRLTKRTVLLCALSILAEGYDVGIMGVVMLALKDEPGWLLGPFELGLLASCALAGMLIGSVTIGTLGDRYKRKLLLVGCISVFSAAMIGSALAPNPWILGLFRFIGGLGMGGIIPLASALTIEYSPSRQQSRNYGIMYSGYSLGIMLVALIAIPVLPEWGWRPLFWAGGIPLMLAPVFWYLLPDSFDNLVGQGKCEEAKILAGKFSIPPGVTDRLIARNLAGLGVRNTQNSFDLVRLLFRPRHRLATGCFWISLMIGLLLVYGFGNWLPTIMRSQGFALGSSLGFLAVFSLCSAAGGVMGGMLADRFGSKRVIALSFTVASLAAVGLAFDNPLIVNYMLVGVAGYGSVSTTLVLTAYTTVWYPGPLRATAVGWALGVGRIGAICGPLIGGLALSLAHGEVAPTLIIFAAFAMIAAASVLFIPARPSVEVSTDKKLYSVEIS